MVYLENFLCADTNVCSGASGWNVLQMSVRSIWSIVQFKLDSPVWICCHNDLSNVKSMVLKSITLSVLESITPFISNNICFMYLGALVLNTYIFILLYPFKLTTLSLHNFVFSIFFYLKFILCNVNIVVFSHHWFSFVWIVIVHLYFQSMCVFLGDITFS